MSSPGDKLSSQCPNGGGFTGSIKHIYGTLEQSTVHTVHYRRVKPLHVFGQLAAHQQNDAAPPQPRRPQLGSSMLGPDDDSNQDAPGAAALHDDGRRRGAAAAVGPRRARRTDGQAGAAWARRQRDGRRRRVDGHPRGRELRLDDPRRQGGGAEAGRAPTVADSSGKLRLPANLAFEVSGPRELTVALDADARNVAIERLAGAWRAEERRAAAAASPWPRASRRVVPARVVDYVAERALRRATTWL